MLSHISFIVATLWIPSAESVSALRLIVCTTRSPNFGLMISLRVVPAVFGIPSHIVNKSDDQAGQPGCASGGRGTSPVAANAASILAPNSFARLRALGLLSGILGNLR